MRVRSIILNPNEREISCLWPWEKKHLMDKHQRSNPYASQVVK